MEKDVFNHIQQLESSLLTAEVRLSYEKLDHLLDDDFIEYGSSGDIYTKKDILDRLPSSTPVIYHMQNFEAHLFSENIVQTRFTTERENTDGSHTISLRTSIWKQSSGTWKMFFHQGTTVKSN